MRFTDAAGRLISVTDAVWAQTRFVYNAHDQITKITDPKGGETTFQTAIKQAVSELSRLRRVEGDP